MVPSRAAGQSILCVFGAGLGDQSVPESTVQKDRNALRSMTRGTAKILKAMERQGRSKLALFADGKDGHQTL